ncbi:MULTISPECIES: hypothetical protein [unclassified Streptomyces]|uniref:hypothetical protein n=1 Tax=unclassified Streptomyces TaxID=2593676 RepID=UPI0022B7340D|nr:MULTISPECIES: hypothetical protein [unclassified Streptomyces]MCZ7417015.1 hypothetical protein [Streptomyces sp. WMMC897]MCZ7433157.1 hypothetical protein [Streptomyces sp. WMMC1477]
MTGCTECARLMRDCAALLRRQAEHHCGRPAQPPGTGDLRRRAVELSRVVREHLAGLEGRR